MEGDNAAVLVALSGETCPHCLVGTLRRAQYKGNWAAVCDACGTPHAQLFRERPATEGGASAHE